MKKVFILVIASVVVLLVFNTASAQYLTHNDVQTQEQYEKTLFGQPISVERNGEIRLADNDPAIRQGLERGESFPSPLCQHGAELDAVRHVAA